jgi:phage gpG-like protein
MPKLMSLIEAAAKFQALGRDMDRLGPAIVAHACQMVCTEAKRVIGTNDYGWPPLAPSTLAHKAADTPLLETGQMRASIEWNSKGCEGHVGSNSDKAVWHELGTSRIPPRSFLMQAAVHMEPKIHKMAGHAVMSVMGGSGLHGLGTADLIHLFRHVGHELKEDVEEILPKNEDENRGRQR